MQQRLVDNMRWVSLSPLLLLFRLLIRVLSACGDEVKLRILSPFLVSSLLLLGSPIRNGCSLLQHCSHCFQIFLSSHRVLYIRIAALDLVYPHPASLRCVSEKSCYSDDPSHPVPKTKTVHSYFLPPSIPYSLLHPTPLATGTIQSDTCQNCLQPNC